MMDDAIDNKNLQLIIATILLAAKLSRDAPSGESLDQKIDGAVYAAGALMAKVGVQ